MWKNKHVVTAMLVAPILAVIAWFAVDRVVAERPHAAIAGETYKLVARSNCRYASGSCDLVNADFRLQLRADDLRAPRFDLTLNSQHALESAMVGLARGAGADSQPVAFETDDPQLRRWRAGLPTPSSPEQRLQIVVVADGAGYYAEVPTAFLLPE